MSFFGKIKKVFFGEDLQKDFTQDGLEERLLLCDFSFEIASKMAKKGAKAKSYNDASLSIKEEAFKILKSSEGLIELKNGLNIILLCGVNGSGKTTTIGKLASEFCKAGKKTMVAACDTFRAAASEQLAILASKCGAEIFSKQRDGEDPASVCFKACEHAILKDFDVLIIDTSGRLYGNTDLMMELEKIYRIAKRFDEKIVTFYKIIVLDSTIGQNNTRQIEEFLKYIPLDGIILTKLDSLARAGSVFSIVTRFQSLKIFKITNGEKESDIIDFNALSFCDSLF